MPRIPLEWQSSVGHLIHAKARVNATCSACGLWRPVDLEELARRRGLNFSLWNKRSSCKTIGPDGARCPGHVFYHAAAGAISRPLLSG